jgi:hypothetical protein
LLHNNALLGLTLPNGSRLVERLFAVRDGIVTTFPLVLFVPLVFFSWRRSGSGPEKSAGISLRLPVPAVDLAFGAILLAALTYTVAIHWSVSNDAGLGPRFLLPGLPFAILLLRRVPVSAHDWVVRVAVVLIGWYFLWTSLGPEHLATLAALRQGFTEQGLSSFLLRNIAEHLHPIPPWFASLMTLGYLAICGWLLRRGLHPALASESRPASQS